MPIVLGYVPIGFAYGVLAQKAGLSVPSTLLMSLFVYAGSSQLIAVGLFASGAQPLSIVATTLIVNLRHLVMSASLSPHMRKWRKSEIAAFAYQLTDETFAVHSTRFAARVPEKSAVFATNLTAQMAWVAGGGLGVLVGQLIEDVRPLGLDYALPAMFIALLALQVKDLVQVCVALLAGCLAVALLLAGLEQWQVIAANVIAAGMAVVLERWIRKPSS
jgi:4-azaleucine resistance transporter AzlC